MDTKDKLKELIRQWREGLVSAEEVLEYLEKAIKSNAI